MKFFLLIILLVAGCSHTEEKPKESGTAKEVETRIQVAANQIATGRPQSALRTLRKTVVKYPKNADALTIYGLAHLAMKNTNAAIDYLAKAYRVESTGARSLNLSSAYLEAKKYKLALKTLSSSFKKHKKYLYKERLHQNMGLAFNKLGMVQKAIESFEKATHINPTYYPSVVELAKLYKRVQEHQKSEAMWNLAHGQCPQCIDPIKVLTRMHLRRGNKSQASELVDFYLSQKNLKPKDRTVALTIKKNLLGEKIINKSKLRTETL